MVKNNSNCSRQSRCGALALHVVDVVPAPPPHRPAAPRLAEGVRVTRRTVCHRDDGLAVVLVSAAESGLGGSQIRGFHSYAAVDFHGAEPLERPGWFHRPFCACLLIGSQIVATQAGTTDAISVLVAVVIATASSVIVARVNFAHRLFSTTLVPHLVDIPPVPPPHRPSAPSFGQRVRVSGVPVSHGNDGLSVVFVSVSQRSLGVSQVGRPRDDAAILSHRAEPLAVADS